MFNNFDVPLVSKRLLVVAIQHHRDNLFLVRYDGCETVISDDVSIAETASNFDDFKIEFLKFLRTRKLNKLDDNLELIYNTGDIIYVNQKYISKQHELEDNLLKCFNHP